jgi:putative phosphoesterase
LLKVFDWKISVTHDQNILCDSNKMQEITQQKDFDVFVYGHTHTADIRWNEKIIFINPGSPTDLASPFSKPSVGLLKITKETITPQIVEL